MAKVCQEEADKTAKSWYIPHHMVNHNGKDRIVFNCSSQHPGLSFNDLLFPGPALGPTLLGVLIRFCQHTVAVSRDIKGMFHQIHILPLTNESCASSGGIWRERRSPRSMSGRFFHSGQHVVPVMPSMLFRNTFKAVPTLDQVWLKQLNDHFMWTAVCIAPPPPRRPRAW